MHVVPAHASHGMGETSHTPSITPKDRFGSVQSLGAQGQERRPYSGTTSVRSSIASVHDKYTLSTTVLGTGHCLFASVRRAVHKSSGKSVAVKIISKDGCSDSDKEAVTTEVAVAARVLPHPNIIQFFQVFETTRHVYLVMEEAKCTLGEIMDEQGPFTEEESACYFVQLMNGVEGIHRSGVVHRDIRPENILLVRGNIKIADFGHSALFDPASQSISGSLITMTASMWESPYFCAPELLEGKPYGKECDVWSAGVVLCKMLSNHNVFDPNLGATVVAETISSIVYDLTEPPWDSVSDSAHELIGSILQRQESRISSTQCLRHKWIRQALAGDFTRYSEVAANPLASTEVSLSTPTQTRIHHAAEGGIIEHELSSSGRRGVRREGQEPRQPPAYHHAVSERSSPVMSRSASQHARRWSVQSDTRSSSEMRSSSELEASERWTNASDSSDRTELLPERRRSSHCSSLGHTYESHEYHITTPLVRKNPDVHKRFSSSLPSQQVKRQSSMPSGNRRSNISGLFDEYGEYDDDCRHRESSYEASQYVTSPEGCHEPHVTSPEGARMSAARMSHLDRRFTGPPNDWERRHKRPAAQSRAEEDPHDYSPENSPDNEYRSPQARTPSARTRRPPELTQMFARHGVQDIENLKRVIRSKSAKCEKALRGFEPPNPTPQNSSRNLLVYKNRRFSDVASAGVYKTELSPIVSRTSTPKHSKHVRSESQSKPSSPIAKASRNVQSFEKPTTPNSKTRRSSIQKRSPKASAMRSPKASAMMRSISSKPMGINTISSPMSDAGDSRDSEMTKSKISSWLAELSGSKKSPPIAPFDRHVKNRVVPKASSFDVVQTSQSQTTSPKSIAYEDMLLSQKAPHENIKAKTLSFRVLSIPKLDSSLFARRSTSKKADSLKKDSEQTNVPEPPSPEENPTSADNSPNAEYGGSSKPTLLQRLLRKRPTQPQSKNASADSADDIAAENKTFPG